ncbi:trifunctional histidinol dehydrogenase [Hypoxylon texense]
MGSIGVADDSRKLYFAYGSNLSSSQMRDRCARSIPVGLARLTGWTWLINERGYANVVRESDPESGSSHSSKKWPKLPFNPLPLLPLVPTCENAKDSDNHGVYGVLYRLHPDDEARLDACEGVPYAYERVFLDVAVVPTPNATRPIGQEDDVSRELWNAREDQMRTGQTVKALVYIDKKNVQPDRPRAEYIDRMNRGIEEATNEWGLPQAYVDTVMRPFIPAKK